MIKSAQQARPQMSHYPKQTGDRVIGDSTGNEIKTPVMVTREDLKIAHQRNMPVVPYEIYESAMKNHGVIIVDDVKGA